MNTVKNYTDREEITKKLSISAIEINNLDVSSVVHQEAVKEYLRSYPSKVNSLKSAKELEFFKLILSLKDGYKLFVNLKNENHTPELVAIYLYERIKAENSIARDKREFSLVVKKCYDDKLIFSFTYKTLSGEEVNYIDNELQMPVPLISQFTISLKLADALALIRKMDISVSLLGYNTIYNELRNVVNKVYRNVLFKITNTNECNYYTLTNKYYEIEEAFKKELNPVLLEYGLSVANVSITNINVPNDAQTTLENDYFNARRVRLENQDRLEYEKQSLELYAKKAEIQSKYPGFTETLTEAEKDNAFRRHQNKLSPKDNSVDINTQKLAVIRHNVLDDEIEKSNDIAPIKKAQPKYALITYISLGILAFIFILCGGQVALIGGGITLGLLGLSVLAFTLYEKKVIDNNREKIQSVEKRNE